MGEPMASTAATPPSTFSDPPPSASSPTKTSSGDDPIGKAKHKPTKIVQVFQYLFSFFPTLPPVCKPPSAPDSKSTDFHRKTSTKNRISGTMYGYRQGKVSLSLQENTKTLPILLLEFPMQTMVLQKELFSGPVRIALECEKSSEKRNLFEEPTWTLFCNGKKIGDGIKRSVTQEDLHVMKVLKTVTTGAGALEGIAEDKGDVQYIRSQFGRVVGSKDSETFYMLNPDVKSGPELTIFFVRL